MNYYLKYLRYIQKKPMLLLAFTLLVLLFGKPVFDIKVNNVMEDWFPENSSKLVDKKEFIEYFGNDELIYLMLSFPDTASQNFKRLTLKNLSDSINTIVGIEQIFMRNHLRSARTILGPGIKSYLKKLETNFFSANEPNIEMIYLKPKLLENFDTYRPLLLDSLYKVCNSLPSNIRKDISGSGVIFNEIIRLSNQESALLLAICFFVIFLVLAWRLKSIKRLGLALGLFLLLFWPSYSLFGWFDLPINVITMVVPILLMINFFAYILHLMNKTFPKQEEYIKTKLPPIIFSALTTVIGFGSLMLSDIRIIKHFGLLTSTGILLGMLVLLLVGVPITLKALERSKPEGFKNKTLIKSSLLQFYKQMTTSKSRWITLLTLCIMASGFFFFNNIKVDTNSLHYLPEDNNIRQSVKYIEKQFGSFSTVDFLVSKKENKPLDRKDFQLIKKISDSILELPFVSGVVSYVDWRPVLGRISAFDTLTYKTIASNYITKDKSNTRISMRIPMGSVNSMKKHLSAISAKINDLKEGADLEIKAVGYLPVYIEQTDLIVFGMLKSLALAVIFITISMILMVGSIKLGLLAIIPNTFPLAGICLFMLGFGIPFDLATSVIACVVVGLVVDDTLHIIWAYKNNLTKLDNQSINLSSAISNLIGPSTTTSIIFTLGFSVLIVSNLQSLHNFGLLTALAITLGWVGDFILFPAILQSLTKKKSMSLINRAA